MGCLSGEMFTLCEHSELKGVPVQPTTAATMSKCIYLHHLHHRRLKLLFFLTVTHTSSQGVSTNIIAMRE